MATNNLEQKPYAPKLYGPSGALRVKSDFNRTRLVAEPVHPTQKKQPTLLCAELIVVVLPLVGRGKLNR